MQLIIHCGAHKTGSSSIQSLLFEQRRELLKQGVLYITEAELNRNGILQYLHRPTTSASTRIEIRSLLTEILDQYRSEKVIISHESIFSFASLYRGGGDFYRSTPQSLKNLALLELGDFFSSIRVVLYVRRQDEFLQSLYMQNLSTGMWTTSFNQTLAEIDCSKISWLSYATNLADFFGHEQLVVRPFEVINNGWKNLVVDFSTASTIDLHSTLAEKKVNESFSTPAYFAALKLMPLFSTKQAKLRVARTLKYALPPSLFGKANPLSEEDSLNILGQLEQDNRRLFATFIKDYSEDFYAPNYLNADHGDRRT